ncbi:MAG: tetratricopeptide repeat protein [Allosphingosinicella sp.]|uniref:tetratricopeptide repeat protein n=1 Tax=Allosphingosinicella sp. TaxID=2823234 RepID=UPI003942B202
MRELPPALLALAAAGCASIPESCRDMSGVTPYLIDVGGRAVLADWTYADEGARLRHLHCRAERGEQAAQLELGRSYEAGDGLAPDLARAADYYRQAAAAIPPRTPIYSPPVRPGGSGQVIWVSNANARPASPEAQFRLGLMLVEGRGVARDEARGRGLIADAAKAGFYPARHWLSLHDSRSRD